MPQMHGGEGQCPRTMGVGHSAGVHGAGSATPARYRARAPAPTTRPRRAARRLAILRLPSGVSLTGPVVWHLRVAPGRPRTNTTHRRIHDPVGLRRRERREICGCPDWGLVERCP
eukprot:3792974-Prymnesium_polylepis.3